MHKTKGNGQLNTLRSRMSQSQQARRTMRMSARSTVAQQLTRNQQVLVGGMNKVGEVVFGRGFFGRLKWLLLGR